MEVTDNPHVGVVVDLVDPYFTAATKKTGQHKYASPASIRAIEWLRAHPGRWAMTAEGSTGLTATMIRTYYPDIYVTEPRPAGYTIARTYARLPHPDGEPLAKALLRRQPRGAGGRPIVMPELERDPFNWTKEELEEACRIARDNLFPVSA